MLELQEGADEKKRQLCLYAKERASGQPVDKPDSERDSCTCADQNKASLLKTTHTMRSTAASLQNVRKQRQLELQLVDLDRKWYKELKGIARERLGLLKELCRINKDLRHKDHFSGAMRGRDVTRFADQAQDRLAQEKESRLLRKFQFEPDPVEKVSLTTLPLMADEVGSAGEDHGKVMTSRDFTRQRMQLQKLNSEQNVFERRTKRRAFLDKSIIGARKVNARGRDGVGWGLSRYAVLANIVSCEARPPQLPDVPAGVSTKEEDVTTSTANEDSSHAENDVDGARMLRESFRSPSNPALSTAVKEEQQHEEPEVKVHPSLSRKDSASLDYLPVLRDVRRQQALISSPSIAGSLPSGHLPPIVKT